MKRQLPLYNVQFSCHVIAKLDIKYRFIKADLLPHFAA
jgi:hypothetical protein